MPPSDGPSCRCSCRTARRRASAASSTWWPNGPTPTRAAPGVEAGRHPGKHRGRGQERPGSAGGARGGSRRRPDVAVLRRGDAQRRRTGGGAADGRAYGWVVPVFCASGAENIGTDCLLEVLVHYTPSPVDWPLPAVDKSSGDAVTTLADESGPTRVFVWKTVADPFAGRISLFRVSPARGNDSTLTNLTRGTAGAHRARWPCRARRRPR